MSETNLAPLRNFVVAFGRLLDRRPAEPEILEEGANLLSALVANDNWLPEAYAQAHPTHYQQYLLHADSTERFSVVSFVWGPGQETPVHDHTVWGLIGMLRGSEYSQPWRMHADGRTAPNGEGVQLNPGQVEAVSPRIGDIHRVHNLHNDSVSISIHVYGANIGAVQRHMYPAAGGCKTFVSGYSNSTLPNLWDQSFEHHKP